jgi:hypothetical protein
MAFAERGKPFCIVVNHRQHAREQEKELVVDVQMLAAQGLSDNEDAGGNAFALQQRKRVMIDAGVSVIEGDRRQRLVERVAALEPLAKFIQRDEAKMLSQPIQLGSSIFELTRLGRIARPWCIRISSTTE